MEACREHGVPLARPCGHRLSIAEWSRGSAAINIHVPAMHYDAYNMLDCTWLHHPLILILAHLLAFVHLWLPVPLPFTLDAALLLVRTCMACDL